MRIAQINCVYAKGSTGRIVEALHHAYQARGHESFVMYGRGRAPAEDGVQKVGLELPSKARSAISRISGNIYGMAALPTWYIQNTIARIRPDVVHLHCINGNFCNVFLLLTWLKRAQIPTVVTQHAEFFYTGNCGYAFDCEQWKTGCRSCPDPKGAIGARRSQAARQNWLRMKQAFEGFQRLQLVGVSDWVTKRSNASLILGQYHCKTVLNGLDTSIFHYTGGDSDRASKREVIYVTPRFEDENKGGRFLLELARRTADLPIHYTVAGETAGEYDAPNITFMGPVSDATTLARLYSNADACLLTSRRETFSMVTAEALCCGTPVVGFEAGAPERISIPEYCAFVPYGNLDALRTALLEQLNRNTDRKRLSETAKHKYGSERMAEEYIDTYRTLIEG